VASENEASVEEILESIKKVIARDSRDTAIRARSRKVEDAEILDAGAEEAPEAVELNEDEVLDLSEMEISEDNDDCEATSDDTSLITEEVRGAMQENLAALAMLSEPPAKPQIVRSGETSLEGMTRDLLRPMLAEWLDKNLPDMVETMVQAEIARITSKRG